jgi:hypothetical protein
VRGIVYHEFNETYVDTGEKHPDGYWLTKRVRQVPTGKRFLFVERVSAEKGPPQNSRDTYIIDPADFTYLRMKEIKD